jgi:three-Cys-motif partner protein
MSPTKIRNKDKGDLIGKWTEEKLDLLGKYLKAYSDIMHKKKEDWLTAYYYIDALAGSGNPKSKDENRYIAGSPLRALQCDPPFDYYKFIELKSRRIKKLKAIKEEYSYLDIEILPGDCNKILINKIIPEITWESFKRGFVFLDPFGLQVSYETVQKLAEAKTFDVFINFPIMGIIRLLKRNEIPSGNTKLLIDKVFGTTEWIKRIYKLRKTLFGDELIERDSIRAEWLAREYLEQVTNHFKYVSFPVIMKNSINVPLYALFLASHKKTGVKIANDIFSNYERLKTKQFLEKYFG